MGGSLHGRYNPIQTPVPLPHPGPWYGMKSEDIEAVIREALTRHEAGRLEYGELDLSIDQRDFILEAEKELLDCINYCVFQILRLRQLKEKMVTKQLHGIHRTRNTKAL